MSNNEINHNRRGFKPAGATRRRFELFALEAWEDNQGRIIQVDHGSVAVMHLEPDNRPLDHQRTFDEFLEEELFWDHHLNSQEAEEADNAENE